MSNDTSARTEAIGFETDTNPLVRSLKPLQAAHHRALSYIETAHRRPVAPKQEAIAGLGGFDGPLPEQGNDPNDTIALLDRIGSPATVTSTGGRFFGLVVGGTLPAALAARTLTSAWDQVVFSEATSPVGVHLEQVASAWLLDLLGLPGDASVGFVTGATMANVTCLAAARHHLLEQAGWDVETKGLWDAPRLRFVAGEQLHVTVRKALSLLGCGTESIETVPCDEQGRLIPDALPALDGRTIILAQAGNVNSGASDPIGEIARRANAAGAWTHVDGAFGLWAAASARTRDQLDGYEAAQSWVVDGHKWLNTPYDCGVAICAHPQALHEAMRTQAPYLKVGGSVAPKDMVPEFSRSARGVEVWAALHSLGRVGVADLIDRCCRHARALAEGLERLGFEILNDVVLNQVVATMPEREHEMAGLAARVQASGEAWFGPTQWRGRAGLRFSIASWATTDDDITRTLDAIESKLETS
ncbi:pyridoxal phosphate-dependent decarboxylase family protein [Roseovarius aquimarinus]|uniref:Pyridoxal phosphate-dependent decarboxylase family protein n=1 Tax=Roseovarius aquimarinus TaxID=1229156 RepID=A0ABW7I603_9RHOB